MRKLLFLLLFCAPLAHATTYYISTSGSDTNPGTKVSPWAHAPGMPGCASNCSITPAAGDQFVLRGCDTFTFSGSGSPSQFNIPSSGSSGNLIVYGGLDQTWYNTSTCPSAWSRPIFDGAGTYPSSGCAALVYAAGNSYIKITQIEFKGFNAVCAPSGSNGYIDTGSSTGMVIDGNYFHGLTISSSANSGEAIYGNGGSDCTVSGNYFDNSDGSPNGGFLYGNQCQVVINNYVASTANVVINGCTDIHGNTFFNAGLNPTGGILHNNMYESNTDTANCVYYNNLTIHGNTGTAANSAQNQLAPSAGNTSYAFNNVIIDSNPGAPHNLMCSAALTSPGGTCDFLNNTVEGGADTAGNSANVGGTPGAGSPPSNDAGTVDKCANPASGGNGPQTVNLENNHFITSSSAPAFTSIAGCTVNTPVTDLVQSQATANGGTQLYSLANYFSPTIGTGLTIGGGTNEYSGLCSTIAAFDSAAGTACRNDTTLGVAVNSSTHQVTGAGRTPNARPSSGAWDVGAYEYSGGASTCSNPSISPASGSYTSPQTITISAGCSVICYTTDGSTPAASTPGTCSHGSTYSMMFSQPIVTTTYVEALATQSSYTNSGVTTNTYTLASGGSGPTSILGGVSASGGIVFKFQ